MKGRYAMRRFWLTIVAVAIWLQASTAPAAMKIRSYAPQQHDRFFDPSDPGKAFIGDPYDWSGAGRYTHWATMLSPSYFLSAYHFHPAVGEPLHFYETNDPDGPREIRTVESGAQIPETDLWLGKLSAPVGRNVAKYPILSLPENSAYDDREIYTFGLAGADAEASSANVRLGRNKIDPDSYGPPPDNLSPTSTVYLFDYDELDSPSGVGADESHLQDADSGGPSLTIFDGSPALVGIHWFIWKDDDDPTIVGSGDSFVPEYAGQIAAAMDGEHLILLPEPVLTWNGSGNGDWDSPDGWTGGELGDTPDVPISAVVSANTVTVTADGDAYSLTVGDGGAVLIGPGNTLEVVTDVEASNGALDLRGTLNARSVQLENSALRIVPGSALNVDGALTMANTHYQYKVGGSENGLLAAGGDVVLTLDSTLAVQAVGRLPELGDTARTVIRSDTAVEGTFTHRPDEGEHAGFGLFYQGVGYHGDTVSVSLFQAALGDVNVDREVNFDDLWAIFVNDKYGTGQTADWTEGDGNGDGVADFDDLWDAFVVSGLYGTGPYADLPPGEEAGGTVDLLAVRPEGLAVDAGEGSSGDYLTGAYEGDFAGQFAWGPGTSDLPKDPVVAYTIKATSEVYGQTAIVPEPGTLLMVATVLGLLMAIRFCRRPK